LAWAGFGIFAFFRINAWGNEYDRKMALINSGQVAPETLRVDSISRERESGRWNIRLRGGSLRDPEFRTINDRAGLAVGSNVAAYRFDDSYLFPQFDTGGHHWGKWVFLAFGVVPPLLVGGGIAVVSRLRRRRERDSEAKGLALPKAYSLDRLAFDDEPNDHQVSVLLGSPGGGDVVLKETNGVLSAKPRPIPMKFIVPWMIFIAVVITAMPWIVRLFGKRISGPEFWVIIPVIWLFVLPTFLGILHTVNKHFAAEMDYFRLHRHRQTLDLPHSGVELEAGRIEYLTEVKRWYSNGSGWSHIVQINVLARRDGGGFDLFPVVRAPNAIFSRSTADQLARLLNTKVRRVKLSMRQSRALCDGR
jgi:hypothetical protein